MPIIADGKSEIAPHLVIIPPPFGGSITFQEIYYFGRNDRRVRSLRAGDPVPEALAEWEAISTFQLKIQLDLINLNPRVIKRLLPFRLWRIVAITIWQ